MSMTKEQAAEILNDKNASAEQKSEAGRVLGHDGSRNDHNMTKSEAGKTLGDSHSSAAEKSEAGEVLGENHKS